MTHTIYTSIQAKIFVTSSLSSDKQDELSGTGSDFPFYFILCTDYFHGFLSNAFLSLDVIYLYAQKYYFEICMTKTEIDISFPDMSWSI